MVNIFHSKRKANGLKNNFEVLTSKNLLDVLKISEVC